MTPHPPTLRFLLTHLLHVDAPPRQSPAVVAVAAPLTRTRTPPVTVSTTTVTVGRPTSANNKKGGQKKRRDSQEGVGVTHENAYICRRYFDRRILAHRLKHAGTEPYPGCSPARLRHHKRGHHLLAITRTLPPPTRFVVGSAGVTTLHIPREALRCPRARISTRRATT